MSDSIKKRIGHSHLGNMSNKELKKLFDAALVDLAALRTTVNLLTADGNNLQIVTNNLISAVGNLRTTANALVADAVKINANTASANSTVTLTAAAAVTNLNAATLAGSADVAALTLVA